MVFSPLPFFSNQKSKLHLVRFISCREQTHLSTDISVVTLSKFDAAKGHKVCR